MHHHSEVNTRWKTLLEEIQAFLEPCERLVQSRTFKHIVSYFPLFWPKCFCFERHLTVCSSLWFNKLIKIISFLHVVCRWKRYLCLEGKSRHPCSLKGKSVPLSIPSITVQLKKREVSSQPVFSRQLCKHIPTISRETPDYKFMIQTPPWTTSACERPSSCLPSH